MKNIFSFNLPKISPLKTELEKELFDKWKHLLIKKNVSNDDVIQYNLDLTYFLKQEKAKQNTK